MIAKVFITPLLCKDMIFLRKNLKNDLKHAPMVKNGTQMVIDKNGTLRTKEKKVKNEKNGNIYEISDNIY